MLGCFREWAICMERRDEDQGDELRDRKVIKRQHCHSDSSTATSDSSTCLVRAWPEIEEIIEISSALGATGLEHMSKLQCWSCFDIFYIDGFIGSPLSLVGHSSLVCLGLLNGLDKRSVHKVFSAWENGYDDEIPFHNSLHAADVTQACYHALSTVGLQNHVSSSVSLALVLAAIVHDIGHPGVNNNFLIAQRDPRAIRYNDESVLEQFHAATGLEIMDESGVDLFAAHSAHTAVASRKRLVELILATDISKHSHHTKQIQDVIEGQFAWEDENKQLLAAKGIIMCSDISNPARPMRICKQWTERVMEEFYNQSAMEHELGLIVKGSLARGTNPILRNTPLNVPKFQLGFAIHLVLPLYASVVVFPDINLSERLIQLEANIAQLKKDSAAREEELQRPVSEEGPPVQGAASMALSKWSRR